MLVILIFVDNFFGVFIVEIDLMVNLISEIFSLNFFGKYLRNLYFLWLVVVLLEYCIKIEFFKFEIIYCLNCECDFLIV